MDIDAIGRKIKMLVLDVDGVLTNGQIIFGHDGEIMKKFHAQDGMGITVAHQAGLKTAIITGRESQIVHLRSNELKITDVYQGSMSKLDALSELMAKYNLTLEEIAYVGDDLNDLPIMVTVGLACAVANAVPEVKNHAQLVTAHEGGRGAVREVIEFILKSQGKWEEIIAQYTEAKVIEIRQ